jgi:hypothetical protein
MPMTSVTGIRGSIVADAGGRRPRDETAPPHEARTASGRALIPLQPIARGDASPRTRPQASFLAHLIATADQLPQTRERRRAEPEDAIAAYGAANAETPTPAGRVLFRTT